MKFKLYPWKMSSEGAKLLADTMSITMTRTPSEFKRNDVAINWGSGDPLGLSNSHTVLNHYPAVLRAIDKITSFKAFNAAHVPTLAWTLSANKAQDWSNEGHKVYGRLNAGADGYGLKVFQARSTIPSEYHFYTKRFATSREFRVNCAFGEAIDITEKKRRNGTTPNEDIRCGNDWVYCRNNLSTFPQRQLADVAAKAVSCLGLDFGGVDVGMANNGTLAVFEVNTAPWLGTIIARKYKEAFEEHFICE